MSRKVNGLAIVKKCSRAFTSITIIRVIMPLYGLKKLQTSVTDERWPLYAGLLFCIKCEFVHTCTIFMKELNDYRKYL